MDDDHDGKLRFRTIWISDLHLGSASCQATLLLDFLRHTESAHLYLVGDIVDGWRLKRRWYWPQAHNDVVQKILRKARKGTSFIGTVKDSTLVSIVNVYDLSGTLKLAMGDAEWRPYSVEMYIMVSAIYLTIGLSIAAYGRYLERRYALK